MKIYFQRFVVGAPNLIELPIVPYNTTINGSDLVRDQHIYSLFVWCYDTNYPSGIGINALSAFVHPNFTIGSLEQLLPPNVYLHERYRHSMDETVFEFPDTDTEDEDDYEGISNDAIHHELLQFRDDLKTGKYVNLFKDFLKKLREAKARGISFMANSEPSDEKATGKGIPPTTPQSEKDKEEKKRPSMMKPGPKRPGDVDRDQQALNDLKEQDVQPGVPPEPLETEKKKEKKIRKPKYATFLGLSKKGPKFDALKKALQAKAEKPKGTLDDLIPQEIREKSKQQGRSILSFVSEVKKKPPKPEPGMEGEKKPEEEKPKTEGKAKEEKGKVNKQKLMEALNMLKSNGKKTEAGKSQKKEVKKQPGNNKKPEKKEQKKEQAEKGEKKKEKKGEQVTILLNFTYVQLINYQRGRGSISQQLIHSSQIACQLEQDTFGELVQDKMKVQERIYLAQHSNEQARTGFCLSSLLTKSLPASRTLKHLCGLLLFLKPQDQSRFDSLVCDCIGIGEVLLQRVVACNSHYAYSCRSNLYPLHNLVQMPSVTIAYTIIIQFREPYYIVLIRPELILQQNLSREYNNRKLRMDPAIRMLREQINKVISKIQKLETELNSAMLDIQKYHEIILELDNWIYLMNLMENEQYSLVVNEVDKNLKVVDSMKMSNMELKKEILFQKKMQHDIVEGTKRQHENIKLENIEMHYETGPIIYNAKTTMQQTVKLIEEEVENLRERNEEMERKMKKRPNFMQCVKAAEEIEELTKAKATIIQMLKSEQQVEKEREEKKAGTNSMFSCLQPTSSIDFTVFSSNNM
eukprot:TRINITY_DN3455_c0_g1_i1.p1 TRINITY_DN3455_c0_g1~~TRINITY_DN3455_c0_g1_i1.p1  ORF type:complete len:804 (-),score=84.56 TRINITY_DN3455_c0_g1_i1:2435-4846(-)